MLKKLVLSILLVLVAFASFSQDSAKPDLKVVNDPLPWTNTLRLKTYQKNKIMEINEAFYNALIVQDPQRQRVKTRSELTKLMEERSEGIWNTFSSKQKNIWKKLAASYNGKEERVTL